MTRTASIGGLFDDLVGSGKQRGWYREAGRLRGFEVDSVINE